MRPYHLLTQCFALGLFVHRVNQNGACAGLMVTDDFGNLVFIDHQAARASTVGA